MIKSKKKVLTHSSNFKGGKLDLIQERFNTNPRFNTKPRFTKTKQIYQQKSQKPQNTEYNALNNMSFKKMSFNKKEYIQDTQDLQDAQDAPDTNELYHNLSKLNYKKHINPFYNTANLKQKPLKFQTKFLTPIQKIRNLLNDNPSAVISLEQIQDFINNPEPVQPSYNIHDGSSEEKTIVSSISTNEAISRICDFD
jgi:hypothetical protein